jgi:multiple sugar transport system permease protein
MSNAEIEVRHLPEALRARPARRPATRAQRLTQSALQHGVLVAIGLLFLAPLLWMISSSLKANDQLFVAQPIWVPQPPRWENYPKALNYIPFFTYLKNTLFICGMCVIGSLLSCSLVAYGFSRIDWPGREPLFFVLLATMMLPAQVTMIPSFLLFRWLGWYGTYKPLIVPSFFASAFLVFLLRQFFLTIPKELSEAARIDGASEFTTFARVILPLAKPALATVALFTFLSHWNDFLGPLLYLKDQSKYTLALGLQQFLNAYRSEWGLLMAASTVVTVPIIVLFFFTQRTFIQGIAMTGTKG